jgi:hypothetical protein
MNASELNVYIKRKFRIKGISTIPYAGWLVSTRENLAELFAEAGFKTGAEIGVRWGEYSEMIIRKNPGVKMFCIDSWAPYGRTGPIRQARIFRRAYKVLTPLGATLIKKPSMEALADFQDESLDFVYIDAMHDFDNVMMDIIGWSKKVRRGGIVSGHDYTNLPGCGVVSGVEGYTRGHSILEWYITQDELHSFFWVKP